MEAWREGSEGRDRSREAGGGKGRRIWRGEGEEDPERVGRREWGGGGGGRSLGMRLVITTTYLCDIPV